MNNTDNFLELIWFSQRENELLKDIGAFTAFLFPDEYILLSAEKLSSQVASLVKASPTGLVRLTAA